MLFKRFQFSLLNDSVLDEWTSDLRRTTHIREIYLTSIDEREEKEVKSDRSTREQDSTPLRASERRNEMYKRLRP